MTLQSDLALAQSGLGRLRAGRLPLTFRATQALAMGEVCARGTPIPPEVRRTGFDLSYWNGPVNHETAYNAGIRFGYFRATLGGTYLDPYYSANAILAGDAYLWGAYHAVTTTPSGSSQANWFADQIEDNPGKLIPVFDVECQAIASSLIKSFCLQLYSRLQTYGMIYTSAYFWDKVTGTDKAWIVERCPLYVAHWATLSPILPAGYTDYSVHQFSADGNKLAKTYGGGEPGWEPDIDLDYTRQAWLDSFSPSPTLEQRMAALELRVDALEHPNVS